MAWRLRRIKWWLGGVRHGAGYRDALEKIDAQDDAMSQAGAGVWALELARNTLRDGEAYTNTATPKLREAFQFYRDNYKGN